MLKQHLRMGCNLSDARRQWQRVCGSRIFVTMRDSPGHCRGGSERGEGGILRVARCNGPYELELLEQRQCRETPDVAERPRPDDRSFDRRGVLRAHGNALRELGATRGALSKCVKNEMESTRERERRKKQTMGLPAGRWCTRMMDNINGQNCVGGQQEQQHEILFEVEGTRSCLVAATDQSASFSECGALLRNVSVTCKCAVSKRAAAPFR